jgi:uncharacterized protein YndB with AHSA1/START domain
VERRVGGVYRLIDPPAKLVYTWKWEESAGAESVVTVEFLDRGTSTEVLLRHEGLESTEQRDRHEEGWKGCLDKLGSFLKT